MSGHQALWLTRNTGSLAVGPARTIAPGPTEIAVRVRAVAINPLDRVIPTMGAIAFRWLPDPMVLGSDVAGEVVAIGDAVTRFRIGDRVLGLAVGFEKGHGVSEGGFQERVILQAHMACRIPDAMVFEAAAVIPLGLSTAASALFQDDFLGMRHPTVPHDTAGETLLVWGGSTSVGCNAIQLAVASGYDVVTTASPRNFAYLKRLGAREVFDYRSRTTVSDIIVALRGRRIAGAIAIGDGATSACLDVVGASEGKRFVAVATPPVSFERVIMGGSKLLHLPPAMLRMGIRNGLLAAKARRLRARTKFIWGGSLIHNEVGPMIYERFLPNALADGSFIAAPEPLPAGSGLAAIPEAMRRLGRGVSAQKVVVSLPG